MTEIKLFSNWDGSKEEKYYYQLGRLNKDGSIKRYVTGGCSNDDAEIGDKVKVEITRGKYKYLTVLDKSIR